MKRKAFTIMILLFLSATFVAAQEEYVVLEDAQAYYNVDFHPGNSYRWIVATGLNPFVEASADDYSFISESSAAEVQIKWRTAGNYYLIVTETDVQGCTNTKALVVVVLPNKRSVGFKIASSEICYNDWGKNFDQQIVARNSEGIPLEQEFYPLDVNFTVNGELHSQQITFHQQYLSIKEDWYEVYAYLNTVVEVTITEVTDSYGDPVRIRNNDATFTSTILGLPKFQFDTGFPDTINWNSSYSFKVLSNSDYAYEWWYTNESGTRYNFSSTTDTTEQHLWDIPGKYILYVRAFDNVGCSSNAISKSFVVSADTTDYWQNSTAGRDTVIGSCNPYVLQGWTNNNLQLSYSWEPAELLDDPNSPHPVFMPVETTIFTLYVSDDNGHSDILSVKITVSEVQAIAGEDVFIYNNSSLVLDGSASIGSELQYLWTTINGSILNGADTSNPIVDKAGVYYLRVTDRFGCTSVDSVTVGLLTQAPVLQNDYDTTAFQTEIKIPVLVNDSDPENDIDSLSLSIKTPPFNGTAYVDYEDYTIHYTPNTGFSGNDNFEYEICDKQSNCSNATVFVMVSDSRFFIPDAFSPNGDGINDYFEIVGIQLYENNTIEIFNRWGNKVYEAENYGISTSPIFWDGKSNTVIRHGNEALPSGTYFYILNLGNGEKRIAGMVYLDR